MNYDTLRCILQGIRKSGGGATGTPVDATVNAVMGGANPTGPAVTTLLGTPLSAFFPPGACDPATIWANIAACVSGDPTTVPPGFDCTTKLVDLMPPAGS